MGKLVQETSLDPGNTRNNPVERKQATTQGAVGNARSDTTHQIHLSPFRPNLPTYLGKKLGNWHILSTSQNFPFKKLGNHQESSFHMPVFDQGFPKQSPNSQNATNQQKNQEILVLRDLKYYLSTTLVVILLVYSKINQDYYYQVVFLVYLLIVFC